MTLFAKIYIQIAQEIKERFLNPLNSFSAPIFMLGVGVIFSLILTPDFGVAGINLLGTELALLAWLSVMLDSSREFTAPDFSSRIEWLILADKNALLSFVFVRYIVSLLWHVVFLFFVTIIFSIINQSLIGEALLAYLLVAMSVAPMLSFGLMVAAMMRGVRSGSILLFIMLPLTLAPLLFAMIGIKNDGGYHIWLSLSIMIVVSFIFMPFAISSVLSNSIKR